MIGQIVKPVPLLPNGPQWYLNHGTWWFCSLVKNIYIYIYKLCFSEEWKGHTFYLVVMEGTACLKDESEKDDLFCIYNLPDFAVENESRVLCLQLQHAWPISFDKQKRKYVNIELTNRCQVSTNIVFWMISSCVGSCSFSVAVSTARASF